MLKKCDETNTYGSPEWANCIVGCGSSTGDSDDKTTTTSSSNFQARRSQSGGGRQNKGVNDSFAKKGTGGPGDGDTPQEAGCWDTTGDKLLRTCPLSYLLWTLSWWPIY